MCLALTTKATEQTMKNQNGYVMITVLVLMVLLGILSTTALNTSLKGVQTSSVVTQGLKSFILADSGINIGAQILSDEHDEFVLTSSSFDQVLLSNISGSLLGTLVTDIDDNSTNTVRVGKKDQKTQVLFKYNGISDGESLDMTSLKMHNYNIYAKGISSESVSLVESSYKKMF